MPASLRSDFIHIASERTIHIAGIHRLRSKAFTFSTEAREAVNFYVWDSEEAAKNFFNENLLQRVTSLYGVRPSIEFVEIATLVDNTATK
jgi:heme-degrading monooxygenase HmoA